MSKTQRWEWAIGLRLEELDNSHLQAAYKLNWDNLCKFDSCRKNCKRILCLACFDRSWIENDSANSSNYDNFETTGCEQKRTDLETFVGLKNLGATCYVNCLLQLWFHNPALRKAIYEWDKEGNITGSDGGAGTHMKIQDSTYDMEVSIISPTKTRDDDKTSQIKKSSCKSSEKNNKQAQDSNHQELALVKARTSSPSHSKSQNKELQQTSPIEQLQLIFARMQFTNKKSIDPFSFIDSLALNAAEQQDAQEFGNLFMEFLEKSFANQKNTFVSKIIQKQFCGSYSYVTTCDHCKHSSLSDSKFYELDLSIQNLETIHDCLTEYFRPAPLDGKYNCSRCQKAQSAHRKIVLKSLPPTLNLQLLRFVYDKQRCVRQKLNSYIIFPEILDMSPYLKESDSKSRSAIDPLLEPFRNSHRHLHNGSRQDSVESSIYILSAVLIHRGSSPHSGHYIAHIRDRVTKDWYKFNDDSVERVGPQLQVSSDGESITIVDDRTETIKVNPSNGNKSIRLESKSLKSKTAYMLVYQAQDNEAFSYESDHSEGWVLPDHLQLAVAEENSRSEEIFESLQIAKEVDQQAIELRKNQVRNVYEKLICRDPSDEFEFIDKTWLQNWLTNSSSSAKFPPIDNSHLLCNHSKLDFRKLDQVKCVRSEGAQLLYSEFGGGPRLLDAMCRDCVELEVKLIQLKEKLKEHQKFITSQSKFKLEAGYDFADAYIVGKKSYRDWQLLVMCQFEKSHPDLLNRKRDGKSSNNQHSSDEDDQKIDIISDKKPEVREGNDNNRESDSESDDEAIEKFVFNSDVLCEHNQLIHDATAWRIVPKEVWMIFKNYFGDDPSRPLIELNANTIMCAECKRQEVEQQEIGDIQRAIASKQKSKLPDLFHTRKRASWCSMLPSDEYYALDRQFLSKWQKFLRNPSNQEQPDAVNNRERLICEHGKSLYNHMNSNPILPECPFVLISQKELENLKEFYPVDLTVKFTIDPELAERKLKFHLASQKSSAAKKSSTPQVENARPLDIAGDHDDSSFHGPSFYSESSDVEMLEHKPAPTEPHQVEEELDLEEIDWSECVVSEPDFCSQCHEILKQDELNKLLKYESATIYITKVENATVFGPHNQTNGSGTSNNEHCDNDMKNDSLVKRTDGRDPLKPVLNEIESNEDAHPFKRRKKIYLEDEANDFVPPGVAKQSTPGSANSSMLRRTTRRNRNREQAYTIKPTQTLLELKKEIFLRCQVLPVDQRLFLNETLLDDNSKTMSELRIVPNCSLKLEVDKPMTDNIDLIEDEPSSRKSCAQPETGFKEEIQNMMHSFGDSNQPLIESARLVESIVHEQLDALVERAAGVANLRDSDVVGAEDILFLLRKDKSKLVRLINHLYVKDIKSSIIDGASNSAEVRVHDVTRSQQGRRVKMCYDYLSQLDEFGEYKKVFNQALFDEIKNQRLRRIDSLTRNMSHVDYVNFSKARQISFTSKVKPERFSEWLLSNKPHMKISVFAFEMIQYLAHETVAQIVDMSLLVKQDAERDPHDPLSVLITKSSHNKSEKINLNSHCQQPRSFNLPYDSLRTSGHPKCITPSHIYEALRRYCSPTGPYKEHQLQNRRPPLEILCI